MSFKLQVLYFHLGMNADGEGIVDTYPVMKINDCNEDDLKELEKAGFLEIIDEDYAKVIFAAKSQQGYYSNIIRGAEEHGN